MDLNDRFRELSKEIDKIFESYGILHSLYSTVFENLRKSLTDLPPAKESKVERSIEIFESEKKGVERRQEEISNQLYGQGLLLLVGSAESILREAFRSLIIKNPTTISDKKAGDIQFTFREIRSVDQNADDWLGEMLYEKLREEKNPEARLNFQNMQQLKNIFKDFLGIVIEEETLFRDLHLYWQIRHITIHNSSVIDERFIRNLKSADIDVSGYKIGDEIIVTKGDYQKCKELYEKLFDELSDSIRNSGLNRIT